MRGRLLAVGALVGLASSGYGQSRAPQATANMRQDIKFEQKLGSQVPLDATFLDEHGKRIRIGDYLGEKPVMLQLIFYRCMGACYDMEKMAANLVRSMKYKVPGRDYEFVTLSVHPKETPEQAYSKKDDVMALVRRDDATEGWHFLTGDMANIRKVADAVGFKFAYDEVNDRIAHPAGLVLLTPEGKVGEYFFGRDSYPARFVLAALDRAQQNQIGQPARQLFWGCMSIDPLTGQRTVNIERTIRVVGIIFGSLVAVLIVFLSIRYKTINPAVALKEGGARPKATA